LIRYANYRCGAAMVALGRQSLIEATTRTTALFAKIPFASQFKRLDLRGYGEPPMIQAST
jgi:hypothetical protein